MQVHRVQPDRVVGEPDLGEDVWFDLLGFEGGKGVTIDRPSAAGQGQLVFDVDINVDSLGPVRYLDHYEVPRSQAYRPDHRRRQRLRVGPPWC